MNQQTLTKIIIVIAGFIVAIVVYTLFIYESPAPTAYRYYEKGKDGCCNICKLGKPCGTGCIARMSVCELEFTCACPWRKKISGP